jgi:glycosyltransferase involved in cell wall biosynthesis
MTVSQSSKNDMEWIGMGKNSEIEIINPGIDPTKFSPATKTVNPTILYLGRLKSYKKIDTLIRAMKHILPEQPNAKLVIAGFGEERETLEDLAFKEGVHKSVKFVGKVSDNRKTGFLVEAHNEKAFAEKINLLIKDTNLRHSMEHAAIQWAKEHTWEKSANMLTGLINKVLNLEPVRELEYQPSHKNFKVEYEQT